MVQVQLGYAADGVGNGVAYARLSSRTGERLVRAAFRVPLALRQAQDDSVWDRRVSYAAVAAIATLLSDRGIDRVSFLVPDANLVSDRNEHRDVPPPIVLPYVRLGCALNRFKSYALAFGDDPDLVHRARAEVVLNPAA